MVDRRRLTKAELKVLDCAARGLTEQQTADELERSIETVKTNRRRAMRRLEARNMTHAVALWLTRNADRRIAKVRTRS